MDLELKLIVDWLTAFVVRVASIIVCWLPRKSVLALGSGLGDLLYWCLKKRRQIAMGNLKTAFNELSARDRRRICRESFQNIGKTAVEFLRFPKLSFDNIWEEVQVEGKENLIEALNQGNGAIVFLPHFGNWELLALVYGALIPNRARAIAFPLKNGYLDRLLTSYREHLSLKLIMRKQAVRQTLMALRENQAIGFFADQNAGREGIFVDFFGKPASAVRGPVTLALKTGAPIVFSIDIRQPDNRHRVLISPPIDLEASGGNLEEDVKTNTTRILKILEGYIRQYPGQWLWLHDRWKTQPHSGWQATRRLRRGYVKR